MKALNDLMSKILRCESRLRMGMLAEAALKDASPEDKTALEAILNADSNDEIHALAATYLGLHTLAAKIRQERAARLARQASLGPDQLDYMLGLV